MIYTIAEYVATIIESIIIFAFLANVLHFKEQSNIKKYGITTVAFLVFNTLIFMVNWFYTLEGILAILYLMVLILYSKLTLQRKIWFQIFIIILVFVSIYVINIIVSLGTSIIMNISVEQVILMRNPLRIFLLIFTKILLIIFLYIIGNLFLKRKMIFSTVQCIVICLIICISLGTCATFEKVKIENGISGLESNIITICMLLINCLFLVVIYLIASQNNEKIKNELHKMQIESEKKNTQQSVIWNKKLETIQHDIKNHLYCISDLIEKNENERAINYIEKIIEKSVKSIPNQICTNHPAFNAVINLKKNQCNEKQIDFKCFVPEALPDFDDMDLCIIIANLLDNAIEAEMNEEFPAMNFNMSLVGNYLNIKIKNRISKSVLQNNKGLKTTKTDKEHHGLGILSVMDVVQHNDGMCEFFEEENWFVANVMLKLNVVK